MVAFKLLLAASATGLVGALPEPIDRRAIDCAKVTGALSILKKAGPPATAFCSAFLKIPATKTLVTTVTPNAITVATATSTYTSFAQACPVIKQRDTPYELANPVSDAEKRADILPLLAAFAAAKISEGCSCLGLKPRATTTATIAAATPVINTIATTTLCKQCLPNGPGSTCSSGTECCYQRCMSVGSVRICCIPDGNLCGSTDAECCSGYCEYRGPGTRVCNTPS